MRGMSEIYSMILHELRKSGGSMSEKELYDAVSKHLENHLDLELSEKDFSKALLTLETRGLITVTTLKKNMRVVRIVSK